MLDTHSRDKRLRCAAHDPPLQGGTFSAPASGAEGKHQDVDFRALSSVSANFPKSHFRSKSNLCANSICLDHVSRKTHSSEELNVFICRAAALTRVHVNDSEAGLVMREEGNHLLC